MRFSLLSPMVMTMALMSGACGSHDPIAAAPPVKTWRSELGTEMSSTEWGYARENGPKEWCGLDPAYDGCCDQPDATQSPVNITFASVRRADLPELDFDYENRTELEVEHNGHTVEALVPAGAGTLHIGPTAYRLIQFHFHRTSEHRVLGQSAPVEMHLVHKSDAGQIAVVGVFLVQGPEHRALSRIWSHLPQHEGDHFAVREFNLNALLPAYRKTFRYSGSLTTPPCSEMVNWNVFVAPATLSRRQIDEFRRLFSGPEFFEGNRRPTQPLHDRRILTDLDPRFLGGLLN